jgi:hypothetical protein
LVLEVVEVKVATVEVLAVKVGVVVCMSWLITQHLLYLPQ